MARPPFHEAPQRACPAAGLACPRISGGCWRFGHDRRNAADYRGIVEVEERLIEDLICVAQLVQQVDALKR
jgi:hypothetical protein